MSQVIPLAEMFERLRAEVREARFAAVLEEARDWAARRQSASLAAAPSSPDFPASWPMAIALGDVLRWRDADFVHACYQAILRRPPDPPGFAHYLNEVRSGRSRLEIAVGFVTSDEGRKAGVQVAGAQAAAFQLRLGRVPVLGYLLRMAKAILVLPRQVREREAVEAYLLARIAMSQGEGQRLRLETAWLHERLGRNLGARLARLADQSQAVLDRLPNVEAALSNVRAAGVAELAQASAAAKADLTVAVAGLRAELQAARAKVEEAGLAAGENARRVEAQDLRLSAIDSRLAAAQETANRLRADLAALPLHDATTRLADAQNSIARLDAAQRELAQRIDRENAHSAAQDAQMKAVREAGVAEIAQSVSALEGRLTELVTREGELLERRVAERMAAVSAVERDVEALRAALATFRKAGK